MCDKEFASCTVPVYDGLAGRAPQDIWICNHADAQDEQAQASQYAHALTSATGNMQLLCTLNMRFLRSAKGQINV